MIYLAVICALLIGALAYEKRTNVKERETREAAFRLERAGLLNRIQIPEAAPYLEVLPDSEPQYVGFDDDKAFAEERP